MWGWLGSAGAHWDAAWSQASCAWTDPPTWWWWDADIAPTNAEGPAWKHCDRTPCSTAAHECNTDLMWWTVKTYKCHKVLIEQCLGVTLVRPEVIGAPVLLKISVRKQHDHTPRATHVHQQLCGGFCTHKLLNSHYTVESKILKHLEIHDRHLTHVKNAE